MSNKNLHILLEKFPKLNRVSPVTHFFHCVDKLVNYYNITENELFKILGLEKLRIKYTTSNFGLKGKYTIHVLDNSQISDFQVTLKNYRYTRYYVDGMYNTNPILSLIDPRLPKPSGVGEDDLAIIFLDNLNKVKTFYPNERLIMYRTLSQLSFDRRLCLFISAYKSLPKSETSFWRFVTNVFDVKEVYELREELAEKSKPLLRKFNKVYNSRKVRVTRKLTPKDMSLFIMYESIRMKKKREGNMAYDLYDENAVFRGLWKYRPESSQREYAVLLLMYMRNKYQDIACFAEDEVRLQIDDIKSNLQSAKDLLNESLNRIKETAAYCEKEKRFICFDIVIAYKKTGNRGRGAHANSLILDRKLKTGELFEPHGSEYRGSASKKSVDNYYKTLGEFVKSIGFTFIVPSSVCPRYLGPQAIEGRALWRLSTESGYCEAWTFWYIEMRLRNPDIPRTTLLNSLLDIFSKDYSLAQDVIRNYSEVLLTNIETMYTWSIDDIIYKL